MTGSMSSILAVATAALGLMAGVWAEDTELCGEAAFYPSEYTCYNNTSLCPITYSLPTVPCGTSGCVAPQAIACEAGKPKTLPKATSPFTLTAWGVRGTYRNQPVKACGGYLAIGANARECVSCIGAGPGVDCKSYKGKTVLLPDGAMVRLPTPISPASVVQRKTLTCCCSTRHPTSVVDSTGT